MFENSGPYRTGALFVFISALLHIFAFVVGSVTADALMLVPIGIVYLLIAWGLTRGFRWLAYITFFVMCIGGIFAMSQLWTPSPVPGWWTIAIIVADWLAAAALFASLWRTTPNLAH